MRPVSLQKFVFSSAGAIWCVLRLPSPAMATPSFLPGTAVCAGELKAPTNGRLAAARVEVLRNSRRVWLWMMAFTRVTYLQSGKAQLRNRPGCAAGQPIGHSVIPSVNRLRSASIIYIFERITHETTKHNFQLAAPLDGDPAGHCGLCPAIRRRRILCGSRRHQPAAGGFCLG